MMNYSNIYNQLIARAQSRTLDCYAELHHIVPRCLGGSNKKVNLVRLTPEEHYLAHQLLVKMHPGNSKLIHAANMMCVGRSTNKLYGWLRRKMAAEAKQRTGSKNGSFGTRWINDGAVSRKLKIGASIESGWTEGRFYPRQIHFCKKCNSEISGADHRLCVQCVGSSRQRISDSEILNAIGKYTRLVDIARFLGMKNPNNIGNVGKRIKRLQEQCAVLSMAEG